MSPVINLLIFGGLAAAMLLTSILAVTTKSLMRAATYLFLTLLCTAGLYLYLNYHFLAAVQVSVYAGGVVVLFVFAIFLTTPKNLKLKNHDLKRYITGGLISLIGIAVVAFAIFKSKFIYMANPSAEGDVEMSMKEIGTALMGTDKYQYLLAFEMLAILLLASIIGGLMIARKGKKKDEGDSLKEL